jgi:hypothetical protein
VYSFNERATKIRKRRSDSRVFILSFFLGRELATSLELVYIASINRRLYSRIDRREVTSLESKYYIRY